jgi:flagellar capping protein FliD
MTEEEKNESDSRRRGFCGGNVRVQQELQSQLRAEREAFANEIQRLKAELAQRVELYDGVNLQLTKASRQNEALVSENRGLTNQISSFRKDITQAQADLAKANDQIARLFRGLDAISVVETMFSLLRAVGGNPEVSIRVEEPTSTKWCVTVKEGEKIQAVKSGYSLSELINDFILDSSKALEIRRDKINQALNNAVAALGGKKPNEGDK